ncbi:MAG: complex I subunit 4 family protein [Pseudobacter sp.]|uniref:complex I subunit 4 family protein n=1 Tax=Pseudobacter sp. TaxID=2045420 RepID=UPI003F81A7B9
MIPVLLIVIPLLSGLATFLIKQEKAAKTWSLFASIVTLVISVLGITVVKDPAALQANLPWMPLLGSSFAVTLDGMGQILCLLTAVAFPMIFLSTWNATYKNAKNFFALMLLSQAGLMGVFLAYDALLFYFFWELALIPAYFLCSQWGGERRIAVTFKFFVYTFVGSLFMLIGIIYVYLHTPGQSFALEDFYKAALSHKEQDWLFWLFFIAFAVKMPIFPLHTWQPDAYEQSPTATTMVLSGVMVKMGLLGVIRWLAPVLPAATWQQGDTVGLLCVIGMIYASILAMQQDDLKRLVAYSSIAHVGLMCLAIFVTSKEGMQGVMIQMFNHGINVIGLWIVVELIERQFKTRKISELGGLAQKAPGLTILLVVVALANVALPLTNAFIGEFLLFTGVFTSTASKMGWLFTAVAGLSIILSAVYTLNMIQKVFYGNTNQITSNAMDIRPNEKLVLGILVVAILVIGVYPKPFLELTEGTVDAIMSKMINKHPI